LQHHYNRRAQFFLLPWAMLVSAVRWVAGMGVAQKVNAGPPKEKEKGSTDIFA